MAVGGVAGVVLEQAALQGGPLRVSQPLLVITDPVVSIVLSVWLFGEYFVMNAATLAAAAAGFCVMCAGVVVMSLTAPATLQADDRPDLTRPDLTGPGNTEAGVQRGSGCFLSRSTAC